MKKSIKASEQVAINLKVLMDVFEHKPKDLGKLSGITPRMISYILSGERIPSINVCDELAKPYGLQCWQLAMHHLPRDPETGESQRALVRAYMASGKEGKVIIERIARHEAEMQRRKDRDK